MPEIDLPNGYYVLPQGKLANVATFLQMSEMPKRTLIPWPKDYELKRADPADLAEYREGFRIVGKDLMWFSRLIMEDAKLRGILANPEVDSFYLMKSGTVLGLLELDFHDEGQCELAFFGLAPDVIGKGLGRALMDEAIRRAWARPISRLWVHTCTFDHPAALPFYIRSGFLPYARKVEFHDDPRLTGHLDKAAAPQIPIL